METNIKVPSILAKKKAMELDRNIVKKHEERIKNKG
jgi:hypothetical protein